MDGRDTMADTLYSRIAVAPWPDLRAWSDNAIPLCTNEVQTQLE